MTASGPDEADAFLRHLALVAIKAADAEVLAAWADAGPAASRTTWSWLASKAFSTRACAISRAK
jgi:hypothetical protein